MKLHLMDFIMKNPKVQIQIVIRIAWFGYQAIRQ